MACPAYRLSIARDSLRRALTAQEALAAEYRPALSRFEGYRGFPAALGAGGGGLRLALSPGRTALALILAVLAPLGFVLEVLVVEEVLFSRREYEIRSAIYALEGAVLEIRHNLLSPMSTWIVADLWRRGLRPAAGFHSASRRDFFRFRLRASACLARSFSPGFK